MDLLVKDVSENKSLSDKLKLIAGKNGLDKNISNISVMEVEDFPDEDIEENLFILTTLSFCQNDICKADEVFDKLIKKNISAMAIKLNRYISDLPMTLINSANENNIPLFVIKDKTAFSKIIKDITFLMNKIVFQNVSDMNNNYELLYDALNKGENINYFTDKLSKFISKEISIFDNELRFIYASKGSNKKKIFETIKEYNLYKINSKNENRINEDILMYPFESHKGLLGFMFIESNKDLTSEESMILSQFSKFISLCMIDKDLKEIFINNERNKIIREILTNDHASARDILNKLHKINYNISDKFQMLFIKPKYYEDLDSIVSNLNQILVKNKRRDQFIIEKIDEGCLLICNQKNENQGQELINTVYKDLREIKNIRKLIISYSPLIESISDISKSYNLLIKSIELSEKINMENDLINSIIFEEFIMINDINDPRYFSYIDKNVIDPLITLDIKNDDKYFNTLMQCLFSETIQAASEKLYVHKTTITYRLEKIKEATGLDFHNPLHRNKLNFAFMRFICKKTFN